MSKDGDAAGAKGNDKPERYVFFVGKERYETDQQALTAGQILARVPNVEPGDKLSLEGRGQEPDRILGDEELVQLSKDHGPLRFVVVPSASFGS